MCDNRESIETTNMNIKPKATAFIIFKAIRGSLQVSISLILLSIAARSEDSTGIGFVFALLFFLAITTIIFVFKVVEAYFNFQKEGYQITDNRIIYTSGGIFSDKKTELNIRNITNVTLTLPFIENLVFGTGHINIESAGSGDSEIKLMSVSDPHKHYDSILAAMRKNGFQLNQEELLHQQQPNKKVIVLEVGKFIIGNLLLISFLGPTVVSFTDFDKLTLAFVFGIIGLSIIIQILAIVIRSFDILNRKYCVYNDSLVYTEGFLTKRHSTLPLEKFSDSEYTQGLLQQILGLYTIKLSARGSTNQISFNYLSNGKHLESIIDSAINKFSTSKTKSPDAKQVVNNPSTYHQEFDTTATLEFKPQLLRSIILPLSIIFFIAAMGLFAFAILDKESASIILVSVIALAAICCLFVGIGIIRFIATSYSIRPSGFGYSFAFLNTINTQFQAEKTTAVIINRDPIDRILGTCTINIQSIGSGDNIVYKAVKYSSELESLILSKIGYNQKQKPIQKFHSKFNLMTWLSSHIVGLAVIGMFFMASFLFSIFVREVAVILFVTAAGVATLLIIMSLVIYDGYYYKQLSYELTANFLVVQEGIITLSSKYAVIGFIKDITTVAYPFSNYGSLQFNIAGDIHIPKDQKKQQRPSLQPYYQQQPTGFTFGSNNFRIDFVDNVHRMDDLVDSYLLEKPQIDFDQEKAIQGLKGDHVQMTAKPSVINGLPPFILLGLFPPTWPILLIILPLYIWDISVKSYELEQFRVVYKFGKIYKSQTSILYENIDFIEVQQNFVNKLINNGSVNINTEGSNTTEMEIKDIPNYREIYEFLKGVYEK